MTRSAIKLAVILMNNIYSTRLERKAVWSLRGIGIVDRPLKDEEIGRTGSGNVGDPMGVFLEPSGDFALPVCRHHDPRMIVKDWTAVSHLGCTLYANVSILFPSAEMWKFGFRLLRQLWARSLSSSLEGASGITGLVDSCLLAGNEAASTNHEFTEEESRLLKSFELSDCFEVLQTVSFNRDFSPHSLNFTFMYGQVWATPSLFKRLSLSLSFILALDAIKSLAMGPPGQLQGRAFRSSAPAGSSTEPRSKVQDRTVLASDWTSPGTAGEELPSSEVTWPGPPPRRGWPARPARRPAA
eukprot:767730-Hanusia_phi.AAC.1